MFIPVFKPGAVGDLGPKECVCVNPAQVKHISFTPKVDNFSSVNTIRVTFADNTYIDVIGDSLRTLAKQMSVALTSSVSPAAAAPLPDDTVRRLFDIGMDKSIDVDEDE